jgi:nitrite reductase/ring-hydroxylating ferredoxin subunit
VREDRRGFLAGLVAALFGVPGVAALLGGRGTRGRWIDAGPLDALPDGEAKRFAYEVSAGWEKRQRTAFLVRKGDTVIALDATCTHAGCMVRPAARDDAGGGAGAFTCPCHGGAFSIDGEPVKKPVTRPLARLETRVEDGQVKVRA